MKLTMAAVLSLTGAGLANCTSPPIRSCNNPSASCYSTYIKQHDLLLVEYSPGGPATPGTTPEIYTVHGDGTDLNLLGQASGYSPSWTPDGRIIFASTRSGSTQIWVMNADGGDAHQVGDLPATMGPITPQMGRNGLVMFMGQDPNTQPDDNTGIYVMQSDGSGLHEVTQGMEPFLAPSGTWIAYTYQTDAPYHREIWRINTVGSGKQQLTFLGDPNYPDANAPDISPDEKTIAMFSGKESTRMVPGTPPQSVFTFGHRNVAVIPATGGPRKLLTPCQPVTTQAELDASSDKKGNCLIADNPAWSPDGHWLIFDTAFGSATETWMVNVNGQDFQQFYPELRGTVRVALDPMG